MGKIFIICSTLCFTCEIVVYFSFIFFAQTSAFFLLKALISPSFSVIYCFLFASRYQSVFADCCKSSLESEPCCCDVSITLDCNRFKFSMKCFRCDKETYRRHHVKVTNYILIRFFISYVTLIWGRYVQIQRNRLKFICMNCQKLLANVPSSACTRFWTGNRFAYEINVWICGYWILSWLLS